jgi:hypothetical protein
MVGIIMFHPFPKTRGSGRSDGDATLLLLLHPVHRSRTVMHLAKLMRYTGIKQDAFGGRSFTGINMRHYADVPVTFYGSFS